MNHTTRDNKQKIIVDPTKQQQQQQHKAMDYPLYQSTPISSRTSLTRFDSVRQRQCVQQYKSGYYPSDSLLNYPSVNPMLSDLKHHNFSHYYTKAIEAQREQTIDLRSLFAVDEHYVKEKLLLLLFPFVNDKWIFTPNDLTNNNNNIDDDCYKDTANINHKHRPSISGNNIGIRRKTACTKRRVVSAPDLYIPLMALFTYTIMGCYIASSRTNNFSPESMSSLLFWSVILIALEVALWMLTYRLANIASWLNWSHHLAFCGYKFVLMNMAIIINLIMDSLIAYYIATIYTSVALTYYLMRTFHAALINESTTACKSRSHDYITLCFCLIQPVIMLFMSHNLIIPTI